MTNKYQMLEQDEIDGKSLLFQQAKKLSIKED